MRGILTNPEYTPQFSGHETFPLRQLWLKKACDAVVQHHPGLRGPVFSSEESIVDFGVGKNMVTAIRHWGLASGFLEITEDGLQLSSLARRLMGGGKEEGLDPYMEHPSTTWLVHWMLAGRANRSTTWFVLFNHVVQPTFDRQHLLTTLSQFIESRPKLRVSEATLKRDIECCIRSYVPRIGSESPEEVAEPVLGELGLIRETSKGAFSFRRGPKYGLGSGIFAFALLDFWERYDSNASSLSFDVIAHEYGSPGRVFKLDENAIADTLMGLEDFTKARLVWTDTAGMRQVSRFKEASRYLPIYKMDLLQKAYE